MCGKKLKTLVCGLLLVCLVGLDLSYGEVVLTDEQWERIKKSYENLNETEKDNQALIIEKENELKKKEETLNEKEGRLARKENLLNEKEKDLTEREKLVENDKKQSEQLEKLLEKSKKQYRNEQTKKVLYGIGGIALGLVCGWFGNKIIN